VADTTREPFAQVPEWLLVADVSDGAVRLFGILQRYAGKTGQCWPSRMTLAARMRGCSVSKIDRALADLVRVGALDVEARFTPAGDRTSNRYRLHEANPRPSLWRTSPVCDETLSSPAGDLSSPATKEREPVNENQVKPIESTCPQAVDDAEGIRLIRDSLRR
jgi:hypothetical protein